MTTAGTALRAAVGPLTPVSLEDIVAAADLRTRVDRKYLVPAAAVAQIIGTLAERLAVLEVDGRRVSAYESVYFDTPELHCYHQHAYGRRQRFKVRTRTYLESGTCMVEVKSQGGRGETVKARLEHPVDQRDQLTPAARRFSSEFLPADAPVEDLEPSLITTYGRTTFLDTATMTRVTIDTDLAFRDDRSAVDGPSDYLLVETKSPQAATTFDRMLWRSGHRPMSMSKYCLGVALLHHNVPTSRWSRVLRTYFGWTRGDLAPAGSLPAPTTHRPTRVC